MHVKVLHGMDDNFEAFPITNFYQYSAPKTTSPKPQSSKNCIK